MTYALHKLVRYTSVGPNTIRIRQAFINVRKGRKQTFLRKTVPCRANLYKLITYFFFQGNFSQNEAFVSIDEEDLITLTLAFKYRKKYSLWKKILEVLYKKGKEEARILFDEKIKVFRLIEEIKPTSYVK